MNQKYSEKKILYFSAKMAINTRTTMLSLFGEVVIKDGVRTFCEEEGMSEKKDWLEM